MKKLLLALLLMSPLSAMAGEGEVCHSTKPEVRQQTVDPLQDDTKFECPTAGTETIAGLYKKGWRVVTVFGQMMENPLSTPMPETRWTVVIEKI